MYRGRLNCLAVAGFAALLASPPTAVAATIFAAAPIGGIGSGDTHGEVFTAPNADTLLVSFGFFTQNFNAGPADYRALLYAWDGEKATGAALFEQLGTVAPGTVFTRTDVFPAINLVGGAQYVAFFTQLGIPNARPWSQQAAGCMATFIDCPGGDPSPTTDFVRFLGTDPSRFTLDPWRNERLLGNRVRAAFQIQLGEQASQVVPEPTSMALLGIGLLGVARRVRVRLRSGRP